MNYLIGGIGIHLSFYGAGGSVVSTPVGIQRIQGGNKYAPTQEKSWLPKEQIRQYRNVSDPKALPPNMDDKLRPRVRFNVSYVA